MGEYAMYDLSRKDANSLIEFIHESLNCHNLNAFHRLDRKLRRLTADSQGSDSAGRSEVRGKTSFRAYPFPDVSAFQPGLRSVRDAKSTAATESNRSLLEKKITNPCSRAEVILVYALPHLRQALSRSVKDEWQKQASALSYREKEVLQWMSEGKCTWDIAKILRITERTVHYHSQNILQKLEARSRSHAVSIALKQGIIELQ